METKTKIGLVVATAVLLIIGVALTPSIDQDWTTLIATFSMAVMAFIAALSPEIVGGSKEATQ